jgi:hypothetical protein
MTQIIACYSLLWFAVLIQLVVTTSFCSAFAIKYYLVLMNSPQTIDVEVLSICMDGWLDLQDMFVISKTMSCLFMGVMLAILLLPGIIPVSWPACNHSLFILSDTP